MRLKIILILLSGIVFLNQAKAEKATEETSVLAAKEVKAATRIMISTTGAAEFRSYWLDGPHRLVVEFKSRNILSKLGNEIIVNQGVIKKITTSYFGKGKSRLLKSLTFELTQKVPYKIRQENNAILLDIQAPLETPVFQIGGKEIFAETDNKVIIKRLEAMDAALMQVRLPMTEQGGQVAESEVPLKIPEAPLKSPEAKVDEKTIAGISKAKEKAVLPKTIVLPAAEPAEEKKSMVGMIIFWLAGLSLISGLGLLVWRRHKLRIDEKLKGVKLKLEEKNKRLEQEEIIRKAMQEASLQKEKEYQQVKNSFESLKGELVKKGLLKRELSPEEKERPWIPGKSQERRQYCRLPLSQDYNRTIILRIESSSKPGSIKSFASNISSDGLCFETKESFEEKDTINLRLFFYGDIVPMMKIQAHIKWKREIAPVNYYGVSFDLLEEKDKLELSRYIESKI